MIQDALDCRSSQTAPEPMVHEVLVRERQKPESGRRHRSRVHSQVTWSQADGPARNVYNQATVKSRGVRCL